MRRRKKPPIILPMVLVILFLFPAIIPVSAQINTNADSDVSPGVMSEEIAVPVAETETIPEETADTESDPDAAAPPDEMAGIEPGTDTETVPEETAGTDSGTEADAVPEESGTGSDTEETTEVLSDTEQSTASGTIGGFVWADENEDGLMAAEEEKIAGMRVYLFSADNKAEILTETLTDANGVYTFTGIAPGEYSAAVQAQTIDENSYLLPMASLQSGEDNKFDADWESEPFYSYTKAVTVEENGSIINLNAAMRLEKPVMPLSGTGSYYVYNGPTLIGNYGTLKDAVNACNFAGSFTIVAMQDDPGMGDVAEIWSNDRDITLTSGAGGPYTITQTGSNRHLHVYGGSNTTLRLDNIILEGTGAAAGDEKNGGVRIGYNANLVVGSGATIQKCYWDNGGGIYVQDGSVTINGGTVTNNGAQYDGGGIHGSSKAFISINGGSITYNRAADDGGGIYLQDQNNTITLNGGDITNNEAGDGGGIYTQNGIVQLNSGNITQNTATGDGGGIRMTDTEVTINGTNISYNSAAYGAGISANTEYNSLTGNTITMLAGTVTWNSSSQRGGGVNIDKNITFIMHDGDVSYNQAAVGGGMIASVNSKITVYSGSISGNTASGNGGGVLAESSCPVTLDGANILVTDNQAIGGNGGGVYASDSLTINSVSITNNKANDGGGIFSQGTAVITGAAINGNTAVTDGGGIRGTGAAIITLQGTNISGNKAAHGAGLSANNSSTASMDSSSIIAGNIAGKRGGGVNIDNGTVFTLAGGKINTNQAETGGGVIASLNSTFTMNSGEITDNTTTSHGGGLRMEASQLNINGGLVSNNKTASYGGGVYLWANAALDMTGGSMTGNTASGDGGGIFTEDFSYQTPLDSGYANIKVDSSAAVSGNTSGSPQIVPQPGSALIYFDINLLNNNEINYYPQQVAVTYDPNGGNGTAVSKRYGYDSTVILESPSNIELGFTASTPGYEFKHWNTQPDGLGTSYPGDGTGVIHNFKDPVTLYAIWGEQVSTIGGYVFQDDNQNNVYDTSEALANRVVTLYQKDGGGNFVDTGRTATTDSNGWYEFDVAATQSYKVAFKVVDSDGVGAAGFAVKGSSNISSHANHDGFSDEIMAEHLKQHIVNAGYAPPFPVVTGIHSDNLPWMTLMLVSTLAIVGLFAINRRIRYKNS